MQKEVIKNFYHRHMNNRVLKGMLKMYRRGKRRGKKIRVVFLCQMPQLWNKLEGIYQEMQDSPFFTCMILVVPDVSVAGGHQQESLQFFWQLGGTYRVRMAQGKDGLLSLQELQPDYVFYQRPYDHYLPEEYRSYVVANYARICYVPYAYACTKPVEASCYNQAFFQNVYLFFAENSYAGKLMYNRERERYRQGQKKVFDLGYPALDKIQKAEAENSLFWQGETKETWRMLWCPRWTTEQNLGSSHFFDYKEKFPELVQEEKDYSLVFRPHPMMFDNFVKTGEMTEDEVKSYISVYEREERLFYDKEADYYATLWKSDVLIADLTTVMVEYLVTRKPIIYCVSEIAYNGFMKGILAGCYCVESWEELKDTVSMLQRGQDPLKEKRNAVADSLLKGKENAAKAITEEVKKDFYNG